MHWLSWVISAVLNLAGLCLVVSAARRNWREFKRDNGLDD